MAAAYIRPKYDLTGSGDEVPFLTNIPTTASQDIRNAFRFDNYLLNAKLDFWTVYLLSGYQYTLDKDGDPVDETIMQQTVAGVTDQLQGQGSIVFMEILSSHECSGPIVECSTSTTKVHEIGHLLNADHNQGGVMDNASVNFSDISIDVIRRNLRP